eukprot:1192623-Rhodomonas_salina.1
MRNLRSEVSIRWQERKQQHGQHEAGTSVLRCNHRVGGNRCRVGAGAESSSAERSDGSIPGPGSTVLGGGNVERVQRVDDAERGADERDPGEGRGRERARDLEGGGEVGGDAGGDHAGGDAGAGAAAASCGDASVGPGGADP